MRHAASSGFIEGRVQKSITWRDIAVVIAFAVFALAFQIQRWGGYDPVIFMGSDAGVYTEIAAAEAYPHLFIGDALLQRADNYSFYKVAHIFPIRTLGWLTGDDDAPRKRPPAEIGVEMVEPDGHVHCQWSPVGRGWRIAIHSSPPHAASLTFTSFGKTYSVTPSPNFTSNISLPRLSTSITNSPSNGTIPTPALALLMGCNNVIFVLVLMTSPPSARLPVFFI